MATSFLNQTFDDEESDNEFNPGAGGSDAEEDASDSGKPSKRDRRSESDDESKPTRNGRTDIKRSSESPRPIKQKSRGLSDDEDEEQDDGGDADEDNEGEGEDLDEDEEDEDEEDEDEEDEVRSRPRKRRRRGLNQFFEEEAEVDEDDDDLEADEDDVGAEFIQETHPDDDLPPEADQDDRRHRELDRKLQLQASLDAEQQAAQFKERYGRRTTAALNSGSFVPQNLLMPDVNDPSIWGVKCREGKEKEIIGKIMKKFMAAQNSRNPLRICSAFERGDGPMKGYIFVEARRKIDVDDALNNIPDVYPRSKTNLVPVKEMPDLLRVTKSKELVPGSYVRIKRGLYQGDLAVVDEVVDNGLDVTVKLIPRLTYGLDEDDQARPMVTNNLGGDNKRKRMNAFGTGTNVATRPPARLFNENEAKKRHSRHLLANRTLTGKSFTYRNEHYEDGFLIKEFKLQHLITENVDPKLEETLPFTKTDQDGSQALDLETLAHSLRNTNAEGNYLPGDEVEVYAGEQRGIVGRTEGVKGNIVSIRVSEGDLTGQVVEVPVKGLRKRFREGDNVMVVGGSKYRDQAGTVLMIQDDKVTILSQDSQAEITVFSKDLREATGVGGSTERSKFDVRDLVQLDQTTFGCVIKADTQTVRILNQNGSLETRLPSQVSRIDQQKNVVAVDKNGSEIRVGDVVKEPAGENRTGAILHIYRGFLFGFDRTRTVDNAGIWVARCSNVLTTAVKGGRVGAPMTDLTKMNPALQMKAGPEMGPPQRPGPDRLIKRRIKINKGPYKGHRGLVKDTTAGEARIELESKNKVVNINKMDLSVIDPATQNATPYRDWVRARGGPPVMQTGIGSGGSSRVPDGGFGGRTPMGVMDGGRTPAWGSSSRTPAWGGVGSGGPDSGRTPAWKGASGSQTSYGGAGNTTTYGGAGNYGAAGGRTPAWSSNAKTPYGADHGFGSTNNNLSGFDAFAAGSRTPAYGSNTSSRTPAWSGPSNAASAPTPGRSYDAPTPAASAPTPGAGRYDDDAYTPYGGAPTPGAGFSAAQDAPTPAFARSSNREPVKNNRFDAPTPAASAPTPYGGGYDAPTPAAGGGPRYIDDDDDDD